MTSDDFDPERTQAGAPPAGEPVPLTVPGYDLGEELGRGGMGVVYKARHRELNRHVAVKLLFPTDRKDRRVLDRFRKEAEAMALLHHPNIVQVYEVSLDREPHFLAMEYVPGRNLEEVAGVGGALPPEEAARVVMQAARAMDAAHRAGVVHRDLKPANVLIDGADGTAKVTDFGMARQAESSSSLTQRGAVVGTPAYMAPEQARGDNEAVGPAADVYALGAVLYRLLVGRPPFISDDVYALLARVVGDDPEAPRDVSVAVPHDLNTVCLKCLSKAPAGRYASAGDLADDLARYLAGEPVEARPPGAFGRAYRWARRKPILALTYAACSLLYAVHLLAAWGLGVVERQGQIDWMMAAVLGAWALGAYGAQRLHEAGRALTARYLFALMPLAVATLQFMSDRGPSNPGVMLYPALVAGSVLMLPRPSMVWAMAAGTALSYLWLLLYARWFMPARVPTGEAVALVFLALLLTGASQHMALRRSRADSTPARLLTR